MFQRKSNEIANSENAESDSYLMEAQMGQTDILDLILDDR